MEKLKQKIYDKAHFEESNDLARIYFDKSGITLKDASKEDFEELSRLIQLEMYKLLGDESYRMIKDLRMCKKILINKSGVFLYSSGSYFDKREAISFRIDSEKAVYFCCWASGCNRIPFIKGFIKWCDWMKYSNAKENVR